VSTVLKPYTVTSGSTTAAGVSSSGNTVVGNGGTQVGIRVLASGSGIVGGPVRVQNNVLRAMGSHGLHVLQADALTRLDVFNNSLRIPDANTASESLINLATRAAAGTGTVALFNNILQGGAGASVGVAYTVSLAPTRNHNLFHQVGTSYRPSDASAAPPSANDLIADPLFSDDALRVSAISPAVNAGTPTGAPTTAFGAVARPQGAGIDIGAHER
jgi:hypothetical protein